MAVDTLLFVSKRASVIAAALICLAAGRLLLPAEAGPAAPAVANEVRVPISR